jgi:translation initiation factor RLI1
MTIDVNRRNVIKNVNDPGRSYSFVFVVRQRHVCSCSSPVNKTGKLCIEVTAESKISHISEELCIGCGICVKKCPFEAIAIINLPSNLDKDTTHRYGPNSFKLHRLPMPRPGQVLGLVGSNGTGKTTALRVLAGKLKPNLGKHSVKSFDTCSNSFVCRTFVFSRRPIGKKS